MRNIGLFYKEKLDTEFCVEDDYVESGLLIFEDVESKFIIFDLYGLDEFRIKNYLIHYMEGW